MTFQQLYQLDGEKNGSSINAKSIEYQLEEQIISKGGEMMKQPFRLEMIFELCVDHEFSILQSLLATGAWCVLFSHSHAAPDYLRFYHTSSVSLGPQAQHLSACKRLD